MKNVGKAIYSTTVQAWRSYICKVLLIIYSFLTDKIPGQLLKASQGEMTIILRYIEEYQF